MQELEQNVTNGIAKMKLLCSSFELVSGENEAKTLEGKYTNAKHIRQAVQSLIKEGKTLRKDIIALYHAKKVK